MAKHSEHTSRDGNPLLVGHGENVTVVHEVDRKTVPPRISRETTSSAKGVQDREV
jgi:hypothetical protein